MCTWPIAFLHSLLRFRVNGRRVLLVTQNRVAADHMRDIEELLGEMGAVECFVTTDWVPARDVGKDDIEAYFSAGYIHVVAAMCRHWDLVIFTNHPFGFGLWFSPCYRKLYVNHGLHVGKINNPRGEDGVYGRSRVIRPFSRPYYDVMFAASEPEREFAQKVTPELNGRIRVAGYLRADNFLACANEKRDAARRRLGCADDDTVVHIISTWGESSLVALSGDRFPGAMREARGDYRFLFSLHPRYDEFNKSGGASRQEILDRWEDAGALVDRDMDWESLVAAADVAISDHSSLCLYHILLGHAVLLIDVPAGSYVEGSTFSDMKAQLPLLDLEAALGPQLERSRTAGDTREVEAIRRRILDDPGTARQKYSQTLRDLLGL
jgi:hypothetical protein